MKVDDSGGYLIPPEFYSLYHVNSNYKMKIAEIIIIKLRTIKSHLNYCTNCDSVGNGHTEFFFTFD